jgi:hypothetical protein
MCTLSVVFPLFCPTPVTSAADSISHFW